MGRLIATIFNGKILENEKKKKKKFLLHFVKKHPLL